MDPLEAVNAAGIAINALLKLVTMIKAQNGLTDDQILEQFSAHGDETKAVIAGYLAAL